MNEFLRHFSREITLALSWKNVYRELLGYSFIYLRMRRNLCSCAALNFQPETFVSPGANFLLGFIHSKCF